MSGEAASADSEEAKSFPYELSKIINEKGYKLEQIFNVDETALFGKNYQRKPFSPHVRVQYQVTKLLRIGSLFSLVETLVEHTD